MSDRVPDAFLAHLAPRIPDADEREALRCALERPLPTTFRVQSGDEASMLAGLAARGLESVPLPFARGGHRVVSGPDPGTLLEHAVGRLYVQEAASMIAGEALLRTAPAETRLVLDLCASPGSKTTQLAAGLPESATLLANEPAASRVKVLAANLLRTGSAAALSQADGRDLGPRLAGRCDAVLVDAPCSGEGTVRRDPKALRGWHRRRFPRFTGVQSELLRAAAIATRPGGVVVYSTCTLSPEENHEVVAAAVASGDFETIPLGPHFPELVESVTAEGWLWVLPHQHDTGGFFVAALRRRGRGPAAPTPPLPGRPAGWDELSVDVSRDLAERLEGDFGLDLSAVPGRLLRRGDEIRLARDGEIALAAGLGLNRFGWRLASFERGELAPDHELAVVFGEHFRSGVRDLDRDAARHYLLGNVPAVGLAADEELVLARHAGRGLGFLRRRGSRVLNVLPAAWVRSRVD